MHRAIRSLLCSAVLAAASSLARADGGDDQYRFLAGLAEKGMHEMVVREGEDFLKRYGSHPKKDLARYRLANALFELHEVERALPHLRALARFERFEFAAEVAFRLGQAELAAGDPEAARRAFESCIAHGKDYLLEPARFHAAEAAFQTGDFAAASEGYAEVERLYPQGDYLAEASAGRAWCAWKSGDAAETVRRIESHTRRFGAGDAFAAELALLSGEARLALGDAAGALEAYRSVGPGEHADAALRGRAFALAESEKHAESAKAFEELLARAPAGPFAAEAALFAGVERLESGDARGALAALAHPAAGSGPELLYWKARALEKSGAPDDALQTLARALAAGPDEELRARLELARGDVLSTLGRGAEAARAYGSSGSDYALHAAAVAALNAGQTAEAARQAEELLMRFSDSAYAERARVVLGEARFLSGDRAGARRAFAGLDAQASDQALRTRALSRLAWCDYQDGDHAAAAERFGRLAREFPEAPEAEEARFLEGRAREGAGDADGAVRAWSAYLAEFPEGASRASVLAGLARHAELPRALELAETLARDASAGPERTRALFDVAERASAAGEHAAAEGLYRRILAAEAGELALAARYGLAWCLVQTARSPEALRELDLFERGDPAASDAKLCASARALAVWAAHESGEPGRAVRSWRALAEVSSDEEQLFQAAKTAALALQEAGRPAEAAQLLRELLGRVRRPEVAVRALIESAYLALEVGDVDRAEAEVRVAEKRAPGDPALAEAAFFVGEARFERQEVAAALALYRAASAAPSPVAPLALYKLGLAELQSGDLAAAEATLTRLVAEHPQAEVLAEALFLLSEARFQRGDYAAAAEVLERLLREHPTHPVRSKALFRLGLAEVELGRWQAGEARLGELLQREPRFENLAEAELARGRALVALGRGRAARQALARVLALDGESVLAARAHLALGRLSRSEGDLEAALSEFLKVAVLYAADEEVAEALYLAGECLSEQEKPDAARARWSEAAQEHPATKHGALARARLSGAPAESR
jgi:TolA-binding protein